MIACMHNLVVNETKILVVTFLSCDEVTTFDN